MCYEHQEHSYRGHNMYDATIKDVGELYEAIACQYNFLLEMYNGLTSESTSQSPESSQPLTSVLAEIPPICRKCVKFVSSLKSDKIKPHLRLKILNRAAEVFCVIRMIGEICRGIINKIISRFPSGVEDEIQPEEKPDTEILFQTILSTQQTMNEIFQMEKELAFLQNNSKLSKLGVTLLGTVWPGAFGTVSEDEIIRQISRIRASYLSSEMKEYILSVYPVDNYFEHNNVSTKRKEENTKKTEKAQNSEQSISTKYEDKHEGTSQVNKKLHYQNLDANSNPKTSNTYSDEQKEKLLILQAKLIREYEEGTVSVDALLSKFEEGGIWRELDGKNETFAEWKGRLLGIYKEELWTQACLACCNNLLWRSDEPVGNQFRGPLCIMSPDTLSSWAMNFELDNLDTKSELFAPLSTVSSQIRFFTDILAVNRKSTTALRLYTASDSSSAQIRNGQRCSLRGGHFCEAISVAVRRLNTTVASQHHSIQLENNKPLSRQQLMSQDSLLYYSLLDEVNLLATLCNLTDRLHEWIQSRSQWLLDSSQTESYFLIIVVDLPRAIRLLKGIQSGPSLAGHESKDRMNFLLQSRDQYSDGLKQALQRLQEMESKDCNQIGECCYRNAVTTLNSVFPDSRYWQRDFIITSGPSDYIHVFNDKVLAGILLAVVEVESEMQKNVLQSVVDRACQAWLDHILKHKIKFSYAGARQLTRDYRQLCDFIADQPSVKPDALEAAFSAHALHELEGAARLLMRQPLEAPGRGDQLLSSTSSRASGRTPPSRARPIEIQLTAGAPLPPEVHVQRPQLWLALRVRQGETAEEERAEMSRCCGSVIPCMKY